MKKGFVSYYEFSKEELFEMYNLLEKINKKFSRNFIEDEALAHIIMLIRERIKYYIPTKK